MGKRGPAPTPAAQLPHGSSRRKAREREEAGAVRSVPAEPVVESPPARPLPETPEGWRDLCSKLPGFDPERLKGPCTFNDKKARAAIEWIESHVRHKEGVKANQLLRLEDWQRALIANLFGWERPNGRRRFRKVFVYVPRKNGKSLLAAGIACYVFFEDGEASAQVFCAAAKEKQAREVWKMARSIIAKDPELRAKSRTYVSDIKLLADPDSTFAPIASEGKSEHGHSIHLGILDELHAQATPDLMESISTSFGGRAQPILLMLTTADAVGDSVCNRELADAKAVRDNPGDPTKPGHDMAYLPVIYEASTEDNWEAEATWRKANPNFDASPTIAETLRDEVRKAKDQPSYTNAFRRWYLNIQTETATAWLRADQWDACGEPFDTSILLGRECVATLDMASSNDMVAMDLVFPPADGDPNIYVLPHFWVPEEAVKTRNRRNDPLYQRWATAGYLTRTDGNVISDDDILARITAAIEPYKVLRWGVDRALAMQMALRLKERGHEVEFIGQGWLSMGEPCGALEKLLGAKRLRHGGHPVLRWNALNAKIKQVGDNPGARYPVKPNEAGKIDGLVALLMGLRIIGVNLAAAPARFDESTWLAAEPLEF